MPTQQDPLIGDLLSEMRSNAPQNPQEQRTQLNTPTGGAGQDPLIQELRDEQHHRYAESHNPTFTLNVPQGIQDRMEWGDVASQAAKNIIPSTGRAIYGMVQPILHPIDTASNVYGLGKGIYSKAKGALGYEQNPEEKAQTESQLNALVDFYKNRYGTMAGFQHAIAEDPASVLLDLSVPFTMGETALARVPGVLGKIGEAGVASKLTNPVAATAAAGKLAGKIPLGPKGIAGYSTLGEAASAAGEGIGQKIATPFAKIAQVSPSALTEAFKTGIEGGKGAESFTGQMRGKLSGGDLLNALDESLGSVANTRKQNLLQGMSGLQGAPSISDFTPIQKAADDAIASISHLPSAGPARQIIKNIIDDFKNGKIADYQFDPANPSLLDYDKLKQALWDVSKDPMTPQGAVVGDVARAVRKEIGNVSSEYGKVMDDYANLSDLLKDARSVFGKTNQADVSRIRKAMGALGKEDKAQIVRELSQYKGGQNLLKQLAGRELADWSHGSLTGGILGGAGAYGLESYMLGAHPGYAVPAFVAGMYARSPRMLGETAYLSGKAIGKAKDLPPYISAPLAEMGHYGMLNQGDNEFEPNPYLRTHRATGGRTVSSAKAKADKLISMVDSVRKNIGNETSSLLNLDDTTVAKALSIANRGI